MYVTRAPGLPEHGSFVSVLFPRRLLAFIESLGGAGAAGTLAARLRGADVRDKRTRFTVRRGVDADAIHGWWAGAGTAPGPLADAAARLADLPRERPRERPSSASPLLGT